MMLGYVDELWAIIDPIKEKSREIWEGRVTRRKRLRCASEVQG